MTLKERILSSRPAEGQLALFYTGQVGFILRYGDTFVLVDGYLSDFVDKNCCSPAVQWVRRYDAPITGEELDFIDYVFCTHEHKDHADPYTLAAIAKVNRKARYFASATFASDLADYGVPREAICPVKADEMLTLTPDITVTPIPSAHEALNTDENGNYKELGFVFSFAGIRVYHSGDCCMYDGLTERVSGCDIAMIPINGRDYFRNRNDIIGCFDSVEAATLAKEAGIGLLIPTHFDLYAVNEVNPAYFVDCLGKINPTQRYHIFAPGEKYIYEK